jgi:hypothetical protein
MKIGREGAAVVVFHENFSAGNYFEWLWVETISTEIPMIRSEPIVQSSNGIQ